MTRRDRRSFLQIAAAAAGAVAAPALLRAQTSSSAPIKIGVNLPLSGVFALVGQEANKGINMYVDSINKTAAGRKIEVIFEDETVQVNTAVTKARKLLESDGVHALLGGASTPVIYATAALIQKEKVPYIVTVGGGAEITRKSKRNPFTFRSSYNIWAMTYPFAQWVAKSGIKKSYIFCPDYAAGREFAEAFKAGFTEAGGEITGESYAPLTTTDFVPFVTSVAETKPEAVFGFWAAAAAIRFLTAANQIGLNKNAKLLLSGFAVDYDTIPQTGNAIAGSLSVHFWDLGLDNAPNHALVKEYKARFNNVTPSYLPVFGWDAMHAVVAAIEKVKGEVENKEKFAQAFAGLTFDSPRGKMAIDATTHDVVQDLYVREASAGPNNMPTIKVVATLPDARDPFPDRG
jgi:branched-chain amino acid transport system substrate-binding protein